MNPYPHAKAAKTNAAFPIIQLTTIQGKSDPNQIIFLRKADQDLTMFQKKLINWKKTDRHHQDEMRKFCFGRDLNPQHSGLYSDTLPSVPPELLWTMNSGPKTSCYSFSWSMQGSIMIAYIFSKNEEADFLGKIKTILRKSRPNFHQIEKKSDIWPSQLKSDPLLLGTLQMGKVW